MPLFEKAGNHCFRRTLHNEQRSCLTSMTNTFKTKDSLCSCHRASIEMEGENPPLFGMSDVLCSFSELTMNLLCFFFQLYI